MIEFSDSALRQTAEHFDEPTLGRGVRYAMEERVQLVKSDWPAVAKVRGTESYVVTVNFNSAGDHLYGECSCPVGVDCKHAAAAALVVFQELEEGRYDGQAEYQARAVGEWLRELGQGGRSDQEAEPKSSNQVVAFVLEQHDAYVGLAFHRTTRLKRGGYGRSSRMASLGDPARAIPTWLSSEDFRMMTMVRALSRAHLYDTLHAVGQLDGALFQEMAATGRLFWEDVQSMPLRWADPRERQLAWQPTPDEPEEFRLGLGEDLQLLSARESLYVDCTSHTIGRAELGVPAGLVHQLCGGPAVPRKMLATAERSLRTVLGPGLGEAVFGEIVPEEASASEALPALRPRLRVRRGERTHYPRFEFEPEAIYGTASFKLGDWGWQQGAQRAGLIRNMAEEGRLLARMETLVVDAPISLLSQSSKVEHLKAAKHVAQVLAPALLSEGWEVDLEGDFPAELPIMEPVWVEELEPVSNEHMWFSFGLGVSIDGRRVDLLPMLLHAIRDGRINFEEGAFSEVQPVGINLTLPTGELVYVSRERLARWLRPLIELRLRGLNTEDELLLPAVSAAHFAEETPGIFSDTAALTELRARLTGLVELEPKSEGKAFVGELRGYQRKGLAWLRFLHDAGYGGLLSDDMGLGKTVQLLAFIEGLRAGRKLGAKAPVLVVAPRSVVGNWQLETRRFTPKLRSLVHLGAGRSTSAEELCKQHVLITSYQTLLRDIDLFAQLSLSSIVFDEAQALKNPDTKLRRAVTRLRAQSRFCVSGTPIENHLGELWSQVDLVMPGLLGSQRTFGMVFRKPIEKYADSRALEHLRQRIRPFLLRRTKADVDIDLPEKSEIVERVAFDAPQRDLYESLRLILDKEVRAALKARGVQASSLIILDALLRLRQVCCDPRLVKLPQAKKVKASAKLQRLMAMLDELADAGRFALVFSQFTSMLDLIEAECKASGIGYVKLTGSTRDRESVIERFQSGEVPVFLISLKAGGVGLNLTRADTVIHYDPWWNPAAENQATDRAHRIGQTKNLMVYKLVAQNTLEERICVMQQQKQDLTNAALREGGITHFGAEDLQALFTSL